MLVSNHIPGVPWLLPSSGTEGAGNEQIVGIRGSDYGQCKTDGSPYLDTGVGIGDGGCSGELYSSFSAYPGVGIIPPGVFRRKITVIGAAAESAAVQEPTLLNPLALPEPVPMDIQFHEPVYTLSPEEDFMDNSTVALKPDFSSFPARWVSRSSPGPRLLGDRAASLRRLTSPRTCLFSANERRRRWIVSVMAVCFVTPHTAHQTTLGRLESLVFHCIIPGFWSGLALRSQPAFWIWDRGGGFILCRESRLLLRPVNFTGMFV